MTRDLKFRAWCKPEKIMYDVARITFLHGGIQVEPARVSQPNGNGWATEGEGTDVFSRHGCDIELMQYTGKLDINGQEICEGDLIQFLDEKNQSEIEIQEVELDVLNGTNFPHHYKDIEIVGNIYENPELDVS